MKGYFPRLIQQTGITFGPIGNTRHSTLEHSPVRHERRDAVNPIHGNEEKPIETQADQTNRNIHEGVREDPESLATVLENENIQQPLEERFEIKITGEPQNHASEREEQKHQKREPEGQKLVVFDKDIQSSLKRVEPHHEIKADDLLGREEIVEIDTVSRDYAQQSDTHAATTNQEHKKAPGFTPEVKPEEQISQVQSRQTYIKEVRDWVAGIPVVNDEETKGKDITMTQVTEKKGLSASIFSSNVSISMICFMMVSRM